MEQTMRNAFTKDSKKGKSKRVAMYCQTAIKGQIGLPRTTVPIRVIRPQKIPCRKY